ncbi:hypothetical protein [Halotia branconii]|uniref:Uncharacterized protein n=1 Tax=Halotia branconii CENA392 TaxID=1539056 RepID=A0AAJ6P7J3_9CYAN|nr:hypothetical protein [Halotia branconii]WGV23700.1 hypothetical protein QI031_18005 [Halotia branconii CENA392]
MTNSPPNNALPDGFDPWEHLQGQYITEFNRRVRQYFSDHNDNWQPNVADKRSSMRVACTMLDTDNHAMMALRMSFFFDLLGYSKKDLIVYHGSRENIDPPVEGHPKVLLYFSQDMESIPKGYDKVDAEISFRIMNETQATFTEAKAKALGVKIKQQFIQNGQGIVFTKGKDIYSYVDKLNGYRMRVYCTTETDAIDVVRRALECQNFTYNKNNLTKHEPKKTSDPKPGNHLVYGKQRPKKRYRPIANVRFRYATCEVPGMNKEVVLYDTTNKLPAIVFP